MTRIPSTTLTTQRPTTSSADAINDIDLSTFLQLMITELQNQDPLNPLDNKDMLAQISQIREVGATDKLTETLESVLLGQNLASSTSLIGAEVEGLSNDNQRVNGIVERVSIADGQPTLHVEEQTQAKAHSGEGDLEAGNYSYRVVWEDETGQRIGIALDGLETTGEEGVDCAIELAKLPKSTTPKTVFRTDKSGSGSFYQVGVIPDGSQSTFVDRLSDEELSSNILQGRIVAAEAVRRYEMRLKNVTDIRPPE
jgi:flagellar basal-body rod modification protein FlgD